MLPPGFLDAARALVRADTVSAHGTRAAVDALAPLYEAAGLALRRQVVREGSVEHVNALAGPGGTGSGAADPSRTEVPGGLLLVTHLDTVPSGPPEAWTRTAGDPWALTEEGGTLYGLGCADEGAHSSTPHLGVNAIRRAIAWARASGAAIASAKGGSSPNVVPARCQIEVPAPRENGEPRPDAARFLPPGPPRPNLWRALVTAGALEDLWLTLLGEAEPRADARFDPPGAVGGLNVLESEASEAGTEAIYARGAIHATFDGRLLPEHDPDALLARFEERARLWVRELGQGELSLRIEATRNARGMSLAGDAELLRGAGSALREMGLDPSPRAKPTSTEAGVFARKGCEAAVFGPGVSTGNAHTPNERIEIAQLEKAIDAYQRIVLELCGRAT